jgi:hypothetical protein
MNIVTNFRIISMMKRSNFYRVNLGLVATVERNGSRSYNEKDKFSWFYNNRYNTTIYGQGNVGDIKFYTDHYINEDVLAVYYGDNFEEFIFDLDEDHINQKGVDSYLGRILKDVHERYEDLKKKNELKKLEEIKRGDAGKVVNNPGQVSYEDIKAYYEEMRKKNQL